MQNNVPEDGKACYLHEILGPGMKNPLSALPSRKNCNWTVRQGNINCENY